VCFASHMTQGSTRKRQSQSRFYQTSSNSDSLSRLGKKREWVCIFDSSCVCSLSFAPEFEMRVLLVRFFQQMEDLSRWERVILHCWFPASTRFHKEYVQTISVCYSSPPEFFHKNMTHEQLLLTWSTFRAASMGTKLKYFWTTHETVKSARFFSQNHVSRTITFCVIRIVKKFRGTTHFHKFFKNFQLCTHARITKCGSREK